MATKNTGLNLELERQQSSDSDWVFGAFSADCIADIPEEVREHYLPKGERQNIGEEKMDCSSRGAINILETKFNWLFQNGKMINRQWLIDNGYVEDNKIVFSDAFVAINSGTTRDGNSLKAPLEAIRKQGLIPKSMLPQLSSFRDYYNPERISSKAKKLGLEFVERFSINYEKVYERDYGDLLKQDLLDVAGYAWPMPVEGEYPRASLQPNHCFILFKNPRFYAFDNYIDIVDQDYIKKLASDYDFYGYGYRLFISEKIMQQLCLMQRIVELLKKVLGLLHKQKELIKPTEPTMNEKIYATAVASLNKKMITVSKELGCAEALNAVIEKATGTPAGGGNSTLRMYKELQKSNKFEETKYPLPGDIILSPTGYSTRLNERKRPIIPHGHCGVVGKEGFILSNNSKTGLWDNHWKIGAWKMYYRDKGGYPILYYRYKVMHS